MQNCQLVPLTDDSIQKQGPDPSDLKLGSDVAAIGEARRRTDRFLLLNEAVRELTSLRSVPEVCEALYTQVKRLVDCTIFYIGLYSAERREVDIILKMDQGVAYPLRSVQAVESLIGKAIASRQPLVRYSGAATDLALRLAPDARGPRSALFVPMLAGDRVVGAISPHSYKERAYDQDDILIVQALADQAARAIENARLFEQTRSWATTLESVQQLGAGLHRPVSAGEVGRSIAEAVQSLLPCDTYRIMLVEDGTEDLVAFAYGSTGAESRALQEAELRVQKGQGAIGLCAVRDEAVLANGEPGGAGSAGSQPEGANDETTLAVPLRQNKAVIGALALTKRGHDQYGPEHIRMLQLFAEHAALAIANSLVLEQTNQRLDKLNELDELRKEFVSTVRHELRTPLTSIVGFTETLLHFWDRLTIIRQKEMVLKIQTSTTRLQRLVEDLLSNTRMDGAALSLTLEPVDLASQIRQAIVEVTTKYRGQVVIQEAPKDLVSVFADVHRVQQIVVNLLDNAAKYSPEGRPINVRWRVVDGFAEVSIQDFGPGIAEKDMGILFTRFGKIEQPMRSGQSGTGLGLYISRQLVEAMAGAIWVDTEVGRGSTFSFRLPLVARTDQPDVEDVPESSAPLDWQDCS